MSADVANPEERMEKVPAIRILADNLAAEMVRKYGKVNQTALARDSGIAQTSIGITLNPERRMPLSSGREPSPGLSQIERVANALGIEVCELLNPNRERAIRARTLLDLVENHLCGE